MGLLRAPEHEEQQWGYSQGWGKMGTGKSPGLLTEHTPITPPPPIKPDPGSGEHKERFRLKGAKKANQSHSSGTKSSSLLPRSDG